MHVCALQSEGDLINHMNSKVSFLYRSSASVMQASKVLQYLLVTKFIHAHKSVWDNQQLQDIRIKLVHFWLTQCAYPRLKFDDTKTTQSAKSVTVCAHTRLVNACDICGPFETKQHPKATFEECFPDLIKFVAVPTLGTVFKGKNLALEAREWRDTCMHAADVSVYCHTYSCGSGLWQRTPFA
jgi:hypothetical protein